MRESECPSEQESRIEWWRRLIFRQQSAPVPLTQFCRRMGINTRKFYYWRQRLREMDAARQARKAAEMAESASAAAVEAARSARPAGPVSTGREVVIDPLQRFNERADAIAARLEKLVS